jgi:hypothetical protein
MFVIHQASRIALSLVLALQAGTVLVAQAAAPNSCGLVTSAAWAAALSRPVTGGTVSVVNDPAATASSCLYQSGAMFITVQIDQLATAAAAHKEYAEQLANSRDRDQQHSQSTKLETGIGDGAFSSAFTDGTEVEFTAVRGSRLLTFGLVGPGAAAVPHDRLRDLIQAALDH